MAKRGEVKPWKVRYEWDNGIGGTIACYSEDDANREVDKIRAAGVRRGLEVAVSVTLRGAV